jgi:hypothetical protein
VCSVQISSKNRPISGQPGTDRRPESIINRIFRSGEVGEFLRKHPVDPDILVE